MNAKRKYRGFVMIALFVLLFNSAFSFLSSPVQAQVQETNRGHIFFNGVDIDGNEEPHGGCVNEIEAVKFPAGKTLQYVFWLWSPTKGEEIPVMEGDLVVDEDGYGKVQLDFSNTDFQNVTPHEKQGYHLRLEVDGKSKTVWVNCVPPKQEHDWKWDSHLECDFFKISSLNDSDQRLLVEGWMWDDAGEEIYYWYEFNNPAPDAWVNFGMDTPLNYVGYVTGRIVLSDPDTGEEVTRREFQSEYLNCGGCVDDGLWGTLDYTGNHVSGLPVAGKVHNPSANACEDTAYLHVFGSMHKKPEGTDWLESQEYVISFVIPVPAGNQFVNLSSVFDNSEYCWYQADLTPTDEVRVPPYYSGEDMLDYVFVEGTACLPPICEDNDASINKQTMEVTGHAEGNSEAVAWRVVEVESGNVMDEGEGNVADYSFDGQYEVQYQAQFQNVAGEWSTESCLFEFDRPEDKPGGACYEANASMTWENGTLYFEGQGEGNGTAWRVRSLSSGEIMDEGKGSNADFSFQIPWDNRTDVKHKYMLEFLGKDGKWHNNGGCIFKPQLTCPTCGPRVEERIPEGGFQVIFSANVCDVGYCNTLNLPTRVLIRGYADFSIKYKGEWLEAEPLNTMAGTIYQLEFDFTWISDGHDFSLWGADHDTRMRDIGDVNKYSSCSLTVDDYDLSTDGTATWLQPQTAYDWVQYLTSNGYFDNTESGRTNAEQWARTLMDAGQLALP
jgi:hypothetical protein